MLTRARLGMMALTSALGGATVPGCNAATGIDDFAYDRACADAIVAGPENCETETIDENCDGIPRCSTDGLSARAFGSMGAQAGRAVVFDHASHIIVAGTFQGDIDLGETFSSKGDDDVFVVKLDRSGNVLWQRHLGGPGAQDVSGIAVDAADNVILAGSFDGAMEVGTKTLTSEGAADIYVVKLDANGKDVWSKQYGGPMAQTAAALAVSSKNEIIVAGGFAGALDFGSSTDQLLSVGGTDVFVVKLDASGQPTFSRSFGDVDGNSLNQAATAVVAAPGGGFFVGGSFQGTLLQTASGVLQSTGGNDLFVLSFDASNELAWSRAFGSALGESNQLLTSMALAPGGGLFLAGTFEGGLAFTDPAMGDSIQSQGATDLFLARLSAGGTAAWSLGFGTSQAEVKPAVAADSGGHVVLTGSIVGAVNFGVGLKPGSDEDIFLAKFSAEGAAINTPRFLAEDYQHAEAIATDALGNIAIAGMYRGVVKFEAETAEIASMNPDAMASDAFVAVFRP